MVHANAHGSIGFKSAKKSRFRSNQQFQPSAILVWLYTTSLLFSAVAIFCFHVCERVANEANERCAPFGLCVWAERACAHTTWWMWMNVYERWAVACGERLYGVPRTVRWSCFHCVCFSCVSENCCLSFTSFFRTNCLSFHSHHRAHLPAIHRAHTQTPTVCMRVVNVSA